MRFAAPVDLDDIRKLVELRARTIWEGIGRAVLTVPRLLLLFGLKLAIVAMATSLLHWTAGATLLVCGTSLLWLELIALMVRETFGLPSCGPSASTVGILIRAMAGFLCVSFGQGWLDEVARPSILGGLLACAIYGWRLPAMLRDARAARLGLQSLAFSSLPISLGSLATFRGAAGRRAVVGRMSDGPRPWTLTSDGILACIEDTPSMFCTTADRFVMVIADVHAEGSDYRSGGILLAAGGLPLWIVQADDGTRRLRRMRWRLGLSLALDTAQVTLAAAGAFLFLLLFLIPL